jgi:endonuclease/exonuclease/phosphatase family metal-dependent hydrolase
MSTLRIISFNTCFNPCDRNQRLISLCHYIRSHNPDIICLQELVSTTFENLKSCLGYNHYFPENISRGYGSAIISKIPFKDTYTVSLPTSMNMNRSLLVANLSGGPYVLNTHFESEFNQFNQTKISQYNIVAQHMKNLRSYGAVLCTDTNIMKHEEKKFNTIFKTCNDAWKTSGSAPQLEYTCRDLNLRLDRIIYTPNRLKLNKFYLLDRTPDRMIHPSDHYGIMADFKFIN